MYLFEDVLLSNELLAISVWHAWFGERVRPVAHWVLLADDKEDEVFDETCDVPEDGQCSHMYTTTPSHSTPYQTSRQMSQ